MKIKWEAFVLVEIYLAYLLHTVSDSVNIGPYLRLGNGGMIFLLTTDTCNHIL